MSALVPLPIAPPPGVVVTESDRAVEGLGERVGGAGRRRGGKRRRVSPEAGPGEADALLYAQRLSRSRLRRLLPPPRCKDWNTALVKRGSALVTRWVRDSLDGGGRP